MNDLALLEILIASSLYANTNKGHHCSSIRENLANKKELNVNILVKTISQWIK